MRNGASKKGRDVHLYLTDILQSIAEILAFTKKMDFDGFVKDKRTFKAVWKDFEIIGEAVKSLPADIKAKHPEVNWKAVVGMRDKLTHEYFGVSHMILWTTISKDLPGIEKAVKKLLEENGLGA